jgi:hypothetical protein
MKKTLKKYLLPAVIALYLLPMLAACQPAEATPLETPVSIEETVDPAILATPETDLTTVDKEGSTSVNVESLPADSFDNPSQLPDNVAAGLIFMREEEKLAQDVYLKLYEIWGLPIFQNIAASEATHTESIQNLLAAYGLPDPAAGTAPGEFSDPDLQALYEELITTGSQSLEDAITTGAAVEEIDILDLQDYMKDVEANDILRVYSNLIKGSRNHLRSFVNTLSRQTGKIYQPKYLSAADYEAIISTPIETGGQGQGQDQGQGKRNQP